MREILLTQGKVALVDDDDFEWLVQWKWYAHKTKNNWYARRDEKRHPVRKRIYMHVQIMGNSDGLDIDHKNGNGLDNRKFNLRKCTHTENLFNTKISPNNTSGYKGASYDKRREMWMAKIGIGGKTKFLGYYLTAEEAGEAYKKAVSNLGYKNFR